jgi:APA family basic amino acid/polyamine antiporter
MTDSPKRRFNRPGTKTMQRSVKKIGWLSAAALVVANMIGTGAFTTLGLQLEGVQNTWSILLLWVAGGGISLLGVFSYAELSTHLPRSGGEYHYLSKLIHPFVGYLSGWVSVTVGFAAAVSLAAMAMGAYLEKVLHWQPTLTALCVLLGVTAVHSFSIRKSRNFQMLFTVLKVLLVLFLIVTGLVMHNSGDALRWDQSWQMEVTSPAFGVALVYTIYAYSGWNAAAYIVEEIKRPAVNIPRALIAGTLLVSALYVMLQYAFLRQAPLAALTGEVEVGQIVAEQLFGLFGGQWISLIIAFFLVSSISAMVWVGPRVMRAMSADYHLWFFLAKDNDKGIPVRAIWFQAGISALLIATGSFEAVLLYSGFVLQLSTMLAVATVFILRRQDKGMAAGYKSPFYPWAQVLFLLASTWVLVFLFIDRPLESLLGMGNLLLGAATYWLDRWL